MHSRCSWGSGTRETRAGRDRARHGRVHPRDARCRAPRHAGARGADRAGLVRGGWVSPGGLPPRPIHWSSGSTTVGQDPASHEPSRRGVRRVARQGRQARDGPAAALLPPDARSALLDEMLERVLAESNLGDPTHEWAMAILARDDLGHPAADLQRSKMRAILRGHGVVVAARTTGRRALLARDARRRKRDGRLHRPARVPERCAGRARAARPQVAGGRPRTDLPAARRPASRIRFGRVETIAALLLSREHVRLALALLTDLDLEDDAFIGWTDEQQRRHEQRVQARSGTKMSAALEVLLKLPLDEAAKEIASILVTLADDATRSSFFHDDYRAHADRCACAWRCRSKTWSSLSDKRETPSRAA